MQRVRMSKTEGHIWLSSVLAATSLAFFMAILSGDVDTSKATSLKVAVFAFSISLAVNAVISFVSINSKLAQVEEAFDSNIDDVFAVQETALISFVIGFISVIAYFSSLAAFLFFFSGFGVFMMFGYKAAIARKQGKSFPQE
ncbi:hypothetical protein CGI58_24165 [Vibrio parahaemolyticus]|nr:hypothetical protein CGI58_24165 [Vibrio parahaemolyticus]